MGAQNIVGVAGQSRSGNFLTPSDSPASPTPPVGAPYHELHGSNVVARQIEKLGETVGRLGTEFAVSSTKLDRVIADLGQLTSKVDEVNGKINPVRGVVWTLGALWIVAVAVVGWLIAAKATLTFR